MAATEYVYDDNSAWDSPPGPKGELPRTRAWNDRTGGFVESPHPCHRMARTIASAWRSAPVWRLWEPATTAANFLGQSGLDVVVVERPQGLRVPQRRRRKRFGASTAPNPRTADAPNVVWAVDFQFDATTDGRPIKIVSIVDEHTRECLGGLVDRNITSDDLIAELDRLAVDRGYPAVVRCDNRPELACAAMADWAGERTVWVRKSHRAVSAADPRWSEGPLRTRTCP